MQQRIWEHEQFVRWNDLSGELAVKEMVYALPAEEAVGAVSVELGSEPVAARTLQHSELVTINLARPALVTAGQDLVVRLGR